MVNVVKAFEKIQLYSYLERNKLLHPHQGAFRRGKSTEDISLVAFDYIINFLDSGQAEAICAAFLDLRKAYNSLDHCVLLQRLKELNISSGVKVVSELLEWEDSLC